MNYLLVNDAVIMPRFGDVKADARARDILQALFTERKVVQVYLGEIALTGGGIHCVTQDVPGENR
jgi:agmatine deiminase